MRGSLKKVCRGGFIELSAVNFYLFGYNTNCVTHPLTVTPSSMTGVNQMNSAKSVCVPALLIVLITDHVRHRVRRARRRIQWKSSNTHGRGTKSGKSNSNDKPSTEQGTVPEVSLINKLK